MSLTILSNNIEQQETVFKNIAYATFLSKFDFSSRQNSLKSDGSIEVWITYRFGNGEYDYDCLSFIIHSPGSRFQLHQEQLYEYKDEVLFPLAGTNDTPSFICYYFSLTYLRLQPAHKISLYDDCIFGINEIEFLERKSGYVDNWGSIILPEIKTRH